ncbi:hypothetical protein LTR70_007247 [Exophiala xenobiotica]|uniref:Uncharacterized protein n=1 Tax=Lithohypha guttulata TaxID=1690604 RepID=A0ABR0K4W2_9EURO|nr:hypothetical protein LTR24_006831 [Lithohypha guttulata]KAK5314273.1 hypothetical protein LTR70_007247 [Exophiala xenobiotica]
MLMTGTPLSFDARSKPSRITEHKYSQLPQGKRVFIKDIIHYLLPPDAKPAQIAPSLMLKKRGIGTKSNGVVNGNGHSREDSTTSIKEPRPFPYGTPSEPGNPTVIPGEMLKSFAFTFLIRDPHYSIPSYYRCTIPPLDEVTGFYKFYPSEAGYDEVRRVFDYLVATGTVGPSLAGAAQNGEAKATNGVNGAAHDSNGTVNGVNGAAHDPNGTVNGVNGAAHDSNGIVNGANRTVNGTNGVVNGTPAKPNICVIDADDLLDNPAEIIEAYCLTVGLDYSPEMLHWEDDENQQRAKEAFEKWNGFHNDAMDSTELRARTHKKAKKTEDEFDREWTQKYGLKGANIIRKSVDDNMATYLYLKQFALQVTPKHHGYDPRDD